MTTDPRAQALAAGIRDGRRRSLARAITLVESSLPADRAAAEALLAELGETPGTLRIGISGPPGVGKSTLIEALGLHILERGHRLAVLAIDPTSALRGGSILGDKTRMERLVADRRAFIRPSPSGAGAPSRLLGGGALGGVTRRTRETALLCEAAGFDVVIIETVGVGQSEVQVASMVDWFLVLALAGAGDELQGIKRGIMELADALVVNKADGENEGPARRARARYQAALSLVRGHDRPVTVRCCSGLTGDGLDQIWQDAETHQRAASEDGRFQRRRAAQRQAWLRDELLHQLEQRLAATPGLGARMTAVARGRELPPQAARTLLSQLGW